MMESILSASIPAAAAAALFIPAAVAVAQGLTRVHFPVHLELFFDTKYILRTPWFPTTLLNPP
jgi:hypothetical protein